RRDQANGEDQARRYAPSQFEPDGEQRYLLAEPLSLPIAAVQIVRDDREERKEHKLKHGPAPFAASGRFRVWPGNRIRHLAGPHRRAQATSRRPRVLAWWRPRCRRFP